MGIFMMKRKFLRRQPTALLFLERLEWKLSQRLVKKDVLSNYLNNVPALLTALISIFIGLT